MSQLDTDVRLPLSGGSLKPYVAQADEHQRLAWLGDSELRVLLDGQASGGRLTVIEGRGSGNSGHGSPVHIHRNEDETFIVLEGSMTVWVGEERHEISAGGIGFLPRNVPHAYRVPDGAHILNICSPSGLEGMFRAAGWDLSKPKPAGWAMNPQVLGKAASRLGATIIGPPKADI